MPIITYTATEMTDETKAKLIKKLTEVASEVTGTPAQFMNVIINENKATNIGIGGETLVEFKARLEAERTEGGK